MSRAFMVIRRSAPIVLALLVAACSSGDRPRSAVDAPPAASPPSSTAAPALTDRTSASVWRLRSGLNVAALTCRGSGRAPVAEEYRKLLVQHRLLLAAAHSAEERRLGQAGFDRQQTKVYNIYSNQRSPQHFCQAAADAARIANRMDSARLAPAASAMVSDLDRRLR